MPAFCSSGPATVPKRDAVESLTAHEQPVDRDVDREAVRPRRSPWTRVSCAVPCHLVGSCPCARAPRSRVVGHRGRPRRTAARTALSAVRFVRMGSLPVLVAEPARPGRSCAGVRGRARRQMTRRIACIGSPCDPPSVVEERALEAQQGLLALQAARVARERAAGPDDPVARDHDRDRVGAQRTADGARRLRAGRSARRSRRRWRVRRSRPSLVALSTSRANPSISGPIDRAGRTGAGPPGSTRPARGAPRRSSAAASRIRGETLAGEALEQRVAILALERDRRRARGGVTATSSSPIGESIVADGDVEQPLGRGAASASPVRGRASRSARCRRSVPVASDLVGVMPSAP